MSTTAAAAGSDAVFDAATGIHALTSPQNGFCSPRAVGPSASAWGPAVEVDGLTLELGASTILHGLNWRVAAGEVHAIIGPNGCGKSTLLKTLLGQMPHTGRVQLRWPSAQPGVLAYVPQAIECDRTLPMTVLDFLACMVQPQRPVYWGIGREVRTRIMAALEQVGMAARANRRMGDLSGGERQRVLLAQALLPQADIVLLDEPMAALDQAGMAVFESLLAHWRSRGTTIVWVEHDMAAVRRLADRVTAIARGRIEWTDTPQALADAQRLLDLFTRQGARA